MRRFRFDEDGDVAADIREKYGYEGDLLNIFTSNEGASVHKWHHYIPIYDKYFSRYRGTKVRFLEIGVNHGGSLQMWREFFGPDAVLYGIDINPDCAQYDGQAGQVRIGSQADPEFLDKVVEEMGGVDVVLDDGSHHMDHVPVTLKHLFPKVEMGGIYMIEDLHTAYIRRFGGGFTAKSNFFNLMRKLVDDVHQWYHTRGLMVPELEGAIGGIHIHDSIMVLDKEPAVRPVHSRVK